MLNTEKLMDLINNCTEFCCSEKEKERYYLYILEKSFNNDNVEDDLEWLKANQFEDED